MSHKPARTTRRSLWMRELESDLYALRLNLADPAWGNFAAVSAALRPRIRLAWGVHSLGMALLKGSTRLDWACPSDFLEFYDDGVKDGRREVCRILFTRETTVDNLEPLIRGLGMDVDDVIGHLDLDHIQP